MSKVFHSQKGMGGKNSQMKSFIDTVSQSSTRIFWLKDKWRGDGRRKNWCCSAFRRPTLTVSQVTFYWIDIATLLCCCNETPKVMSLLNAGLVILQLWKKHCLGSGALLILHSSCLKFMLWISWVCYRLPVELGYLIKWKSCFKWLDETL